MALVRVIIPTYNRANLISQAVTSVQAQTLSDVEVTIVDDGSTDETQSVVAPFAARDPRIKYYRQANTGVGSA
jgi:glycosyltransferase involved in cell wall biosynthesis